MVAAPASTTPPATVATPFFQNTAYTTQQTPPTTPLSVTTAVSSQEPLFTISDHFVNTTAGGTFATVNGNANTLTSIQGRKMNENLVVSSVNN